MYIYEDSLCMRTCYNSSCFPYKITLSSFPFKTINTCNTCTSVYYFISKYISIADIHVLEACKTINTCDACMCVYF